MSMVSESLGATAPDAFDHAVLAETMPLEKIDVSNPKLYQQDVWQPYFRRLRRDAPVHYCKESPVGPFWSVTKHKDIIAVEVNHKTFSSSSALGGITLRDRPGELELPMFIAMDPPRHDVQRKVVQPIVSPDNLANFEGLIRGRVRAVLDGLPRGETFNWVDKVSIELTGQMLATLFDFPFEDRRKLSYWSDVSTAVPYQGGLVESEEQREAVFRECLGYFMNLWNERLNAEPRPDLISMLAHGEATRNMSAREYLGNVILLIVGGNDTTRNSMSGGLLFLSQNPDEFAKLRAKPELVESMAPEIIRYQTPLAYMRRTAVADVEFGDQLIHKGDKIAMWYISGNRDEEGAGKWFLKASLKAGVAPRAEPLTSAGGWRHKLAALAALMVALAAIAAGVWLFHSTGRMEATAERTAIMVLPFANLSGDSSQNPLAEAVTDGLTDAVSRLATQAARRPVRAEGPRPPGP